MHSQKLGEEGQILLEAQWVITLIAIPLLCGLSIWGMKEYRMAKCSYESFNRARDQLIRQRSSVRRTFTCGSESEPITLLSLEDLDHAHGSGLSISDWANEVSQLSEEFSSLLPSLPAPDSP